MKAVRLKVPTRVLVSLAVAAVTGCDLPRDPEGTLGAVRGAELVVGVAEAPPWIEGGARQPQGVEADIVRRLAAALDADVRWVWLPAEKQVARLSRFEIHLAVGGHTRDSPLAIGVGATRPWYVSTERYGDTEVKRLHHVFLLPPGENGWLVWIERQLEADSIFIHRRTRAVTPGD